MAFSTQGSGVLSVPADTAVEVVESPPGGSTPLNRRGFGPLFWAAAGWLALVLLAALFADVLPIHAADEQLAGPPLSGPTLDHPFGTDSVGYDLFARTLRGARVSTIVAVVSLAVGLGVGGGLGILAGFRRGWLDAIVLWVTDVLITFPGLILALALLSFAGRSLRSVLIAIAVLSVPAYTRVARASALLFSSREFVLAARALGASSRRIMFREIAPNVYISLLAYAALGASVAIVAEGALAFLGLSVPDSISWGSMIADGQSQLRDAPQAALAPTLVMFLTIMSLNFVGERLGAVIDPRSSQL